MIAATTLGRRFVGRDRELDLLLSRLLDATRMRARTVLLTGPAGIGKSRLLRELRSALVHRRARVVESACLEIARRPYAPILDILRAVDREAVSRTLQAQNRREQIDIMCDALLRLSERQTIVAVVEDLHWADAATLELLEFLTTRMGSARLMLVLSSRVDSQSSVRLARLAASDLVDRLDLEPLRRVDCEAFVDDALGGRDLARSKRGHVIRIAEGNPFYIEELLKTTLERGEPSVPSSLAAALLERASALDPSSRSILEAAAILGTEFDVATLCATSACTRSVAIDALLAACDLQVLQPGDPDRYAFRHALTREAFYASIPAVRAAALHRTALAAYGAHDSTDVERLAYHAWNAHDFERSASYAEEAGVAAMKTFAYEDAIVQFEGALAALAVIPHAPIEALVRVYERRALAHIAAGSNANAFSDYTAAAELLRTTPDREREAEMRVDAAVQAYRNGDLAAREPLEAMFDRLEEGDRAASSRLHVGLAQLNANLYRPAAAGRHLDAVDLGVVEQRPRLAYAYRSATAIVRYIEGDLAAYESAFDAWLAAANAVPGMPDVSLVHYNGAMYFSILGAHARALTLFERGLEIARTRRDRMAESATHAMAAMAYLAVGDPASVRRCVDAVYLVATDGKIARAHAAAWGSIAAAHLGDDALSARCVDVDRLEPFAEPMCAAGYAPWLIRAGRATEARALLHRAIVQLERPRGLYLTLLAVARYGDVADLPVAKSLLESAAAASDDFVERPALALFNAYVARRENRSTEAASSAAEAATGFVRLGYPLLAAEALEACDRIDEAVSIYRSCGAAGDLKRLGYAELSVGPSPITIAGRDPLALSERESEIAELVAAGATNRIIGERLACSPKTVEKHLASIFRKLDIESRVQLAAWVINGRPRDRESA